MPRSDTSAPKTFFRSIDRVSPYIDAEPQKDARIEELERKLQKQELELSYYKRFYEDVIRGVQMRLITLLNDQHREGK